MIVICCPGWSAVGGGIPQLRFVYSRPTFTATMLVLVVKNKSTSLLRELNSIFMKNLREILSYWPPNRATLSCHVVANQELRNCASCAPRATRLQWKIRIFHWLKGIECAEQIFYKIKFSANKRRRRRRTASWKGLGRKRWTTSFPCKQRKCEYCPLEQRPLD